MTDPGEHRLTRKSRPAKQTLEAVMSVVAALVVVVVVVV